MSEQNFDEDMISERMAVAPIPAISTARQRSYTVQSSQKNTEKKPNNNDPIDINQLLYGKARQGSRKQLKERQQGLIQNVGKYIKYKNDKLENKKKQIESKERQNCTFRPKTNQKGRQRTITEFLQSQSKFTDKIKLNTDKLKSSLNQQCEYGFKPKINKTVTQLTKQPVHERLYKLKNKQNGVLDNFFIKQSTHIPLISDRSKNLVRESPISQHLYNDAIRRQQSKQISSFQPKISKPKTLNLMNEKYAAQKFIKEYYGVLEELNLHESRDQLNQQIFHQVLLMLNFISQNYNESQQEQTLIREAYQLLKGYSVTIKNVCVFLMAVIGIYHINPINFESNSHQSAEQTDLNLDEVEGRKLQKKFELLFRNKLFAQQLKKTDKEIIYTFKPKINENSQFLAETYRNRMLQETTSLIEQNQLNVTLPKDGIITHADLLTLNKLAKQSQINQKRKILHEGQLRNCTFKPNLYQGKQKSSLSSMLMDLDTGVKKYQQLYNISKNSLKTTKTLIDLEYQRNQKQCTFVPKITKSIPLHPVPGKAPDYDKTVIRMTKARKERQQKQKFLSIHENRRQISKAGKKTQKKQQTTANTMKKDLMTQDEQIPFLVIDVNLGDQVEQIVVYKHETEKAEELARQFSIKHNIDEQSQRKLVELLKIQINSILQKIDEEQQQQYSEV